MLFLFDYDGVIADSFEPLLAVCIEAQKAVGAGRPPTSGDFQQIQNLTFEALGHRIGIPEHRCAAYAGKVFEIQRKGWQVSPFADVVGAIRGLAFNHTVAVVTNSLGVAVAASLDRFGIGEDVTAVMGNESGSTKAERIQYLRSVHVSAEEPVFMIGDTIGDIRAGKQAGVLTVGVTWGFQTRYLLSKEAPDYLLDDPAELLGLGKG